MSGSRDYLSPRREPGSAPRYVRLIEPFLLGPVGAVVEIYRIVGDTVGYRYVEGGREGVAPLRELLAAAKEEERWQKP